MHENDASLIYIRVPESIPRGYQSLPEMKPAKGRLLLASDQLDRSLFAKTVILLVDYGVTGAMGLIINMPTEITLAKLFPDIEVFQHRTDKTYIGGPVSSTHVFLLVQSVDKPENSITVFEDIYLSSSMSSLESLTEDRNSDVKFHAYVGYAGWGPGQLEREIMMGSWHVIEGNAETVFDEKPSELWQKLKRGISRQEQQISI